MVSAWRNFKIIFSRPLFTIIFRPKMLKFYPYSILTGDTRAEFVIYSVLMRSFFSQCKLFSKSQSTYNCAELFKLLRSSIQYCSLAFLLYNKGSNYALSGKTNSKIVYDFREIAD